MTAEVVGCLLSATGPQAVGDGSVAIAGGVWHDPPTRVSAALVAGQQEGEHVYMYQLLRVASASGSPDSSIIYL